MKKTIILIILGLTTSCEVDPIFEEQEHNYEFKMTGRTYQDNDGYYHLPINPTENQQSLHRFGAYVTNIDKWGLPTQIIWRCNIFWYISDTIIVNNIPTGESPWDWENYEITNYEGMTVPIINSISYSDPTIDSVFCMMAPIGAMVGDTAEVFGQAWFEEGDIILYDSFKIIFE